MLIIKKQIGAGISAEIMLDRDTRFYKKCAKCGQMIDFTDKIRGRSNLFYYLSNDYFLCHRCEEDEKATEEFRKQNNPFA